VDDQSVVDEEQTLITGGSMQMPQQQATSWLQSVANEGNEVQELVMWDLLGREDFQDT